MGSEQTSIYSWKESLRVRPTLLVRGPFSHRCVTEVTVSLDPDLLAPLLTSWPQWGVP